MHATFRAGLALASLLTAAQLSAPALAQDRVEDLPELTLRVSFPTGPTPTTERTWGAWGKAIEERSGGKIKFEYFYSGALASAAEMPDALTSGVADLGTVGTPYTPERFPVTNWYGTLSSLPKGGVPFTLVQGIPAHNEFVQTNPDVVQEWEGQGLKILGADYYQAFDILCKKPVQNLEQARGTRVRVPGKLWSDEFVNMGFTPVPMVPAEMYEAFSRGIIDCVALRPSGYGPLGLLDVEGQKYYTAIELSGWTNNFTVMSLDRWNGLPKLAQDILIETLPVYYRGFVEAETEEFKKFYDEAEARNVELLIPDPAMVEAINAYQQKLYSEMVDSAPSQVSDPAGMIASFQGLAEKWKTKAEEMGFAQSADTLEGRRAGMNTIPSLDEWTVEMQKMFTAAE